MLVSCKIAKFYQLNYSIWFKNKKVKTTKQTVNSLSHYV